MVNMKESDVINVIQNALELDGECITMDSSADDVEEWDSVGHVAILSALDKVFNKKVAGIREMATADTVHKMLTLLKDYSLI